jgi:hypothetical protein
MKHFFLTLLTALPLLCASCDRRVYPEPLPSKIPETNLTIYYGKYDCDNSQNITIYPDAIYGHRDKNQANKEGLYNFVPNTYNSYYNNVLVRFEKGKLDKWRALYTTNLQNKAIFSMGNPAGEKMVCSKNINSY